MICFEGMLYAEESLPGHRNPERMMPHESIPACQRCLIPQTGYRESKRTSRRKGHRVRSQGDACAVVTLYAAGSLDETFYKRVVVGYAANGCKT